MIAVCKLLTNTASPLVMMYLIVGGICIHTEGLLLLIDKSNGFIHIIYSEYWENRAEDLLLHDGVRFCHFYQNCWGFKYKHRA